MPYRITEECMGCGACVSECATDAITEADGKYSIDPEKCMECGACEPACPESAIAYQP